MLYGSFLKYSCTSDGYWSSESMLTQRHLKYCSVHQSKFDVPTGRSCSRSMTPSTEYAPKTECLVDLDELDAGVCDLEALVDKGIVGVWALIDAYEGRGVMVRLNALEVDVEIESTGDVCEATDDRGGIIVFLREAGIGVAVVRKEQD